MPITIEPREATTGASQTQAQPGQLSNLVRLCPKIKNKKDWGVAQCKCPRHNPNTTKNKSNIHSKGNHQWCKETTHTMEEIASYSSKDVYLEYKKNKKIKPT